MAIRPNSLVIGGGVIGLAIALELRLRGLSVTLISRQFAEAASHAAAGMLAPQAEQIPPGPMLELCLRSRSLYPEWAQKLETLTGLPTGYWPCGILAPVYSTEAQPSAPIASAVGDWEWLDREAIHQRQSGFGADVSGGWWYPNDAQVDNRLLAKALWLACCEAGVVCREGITAHSIVTDDRQVVGVQTATEWLQAEQYILATGAWSQALLPIPVVPRKGQMVAVRVPIEAASPLPLQTVLFGSESYIVPRRDGRIVIGATSENVGFAPDNTPAGINTLLAQSMRLYPALRQFALQEMWWGFRPATPDELPILGASAYANLTLATGHYRNGILLTPITAQLIADWVEQRQADPLLDAFHWSRFNLR